MTEITIGSKVKLKSGSPPMTVLKESDKIQNWWTCAFFVKEGGVMTVREFTFPADALEALE